MKINYGNGIKLEFSLTNERPDIFLIIDDLNVMSTILSEHNSAKEAIKECPENARVFIGGLGFGLILKYLEESKKTKEIIVCEIDQRIIDLFEKEIREVCLNFKLIKGDAHEEIKKNGLFDWIYIDLSEGEYESYEKEFSFYLTTRGKYTGYRL